jgi:hypothetical protein
VESLVMAPVLTTTIVISVPTRLNLCHKNYLCHLSEYLLFELVVAS